MKIFIAWSKSKSQEIAEKTKELLDSVWGTEHVFLSKEITPGVDFKTFLLEKISISDKLLLCFTSDNKKSPWSLFESGIAEGNKKQIVPILFDDDRNWHSSIDNPLFNWQPIIFDREDFIYRFIDAFEIDNSQENRDKIEKYTKTILTIKENYRLVDASCEEFVEKLIQNNTFIMENPFFNDKTAHFLSGFESFDLYKAIIDSFLFTGKYLWIYGRKNMKLFSGSYSSFFKYLYEIAIKNNLGIDGIDFRCLFLNPKSKEVKLAHLNENILKLELESSILRAKDEIKNNKHLKKCFRFYSNKREEIIIRLDDIIIYSKPVFYADGKPQLLTNTNFEVFSIESERGKYCLHKFEEVWNNAETMK